MRRTCASCIFLLFQALLSHCLGQSVPVTRCATPDPVRVDTALELRIQAHIASHQASLARGQRGDFLTVPVVVFVIDDTSTGFAPVTPAHVREQIAVLNREFAPWGLRFCIARFDSLGQPLQPIVPAPPVVAIRQDDPANPGVFWVEAHTAGLPNNWARVWPQWGSPNHPAMLAAITDLSPQDYLFIFCHEIGPGTQVLGLAGQASVVQLPPSGDGVAVRRDIFGGPSTCAGGCPCEADQGKYLVHEVGHLLELSHVFFGGACAGNTPQDCHMMGDRICDIPYQNGWTNAYDCNLPSTYAGPVCSQPVVPGNHMDYLADWKRTSFTPGQADRMHAHLQLQLPHLFDPAHVARVGCAARILYVNAAAPAGQGGTSWVDAFDNLHSALASAQPGDEIWVTLGIYRPTTTGDSAASFVIPDGVQVYGGFAGTEAARTQRSLAVNPSILDGGGIARHVVRSTAGKFSVLDGFTIQDGHGIGGPEGGKGAGVFLDGSELSLSQCTIQDHQGEAGSVFVRGGSPSLQRCRISQNNANSGVAGLLVKAGAQVRATDCGFISNDSPFGGASAIAVLDSSSILLVNSILSDNFGISGALVVEDRAQADILNATFFGNSVPAAIQVASANARLRVYNTILYDHPADIDNQLGDPANEVSYSSLEHLPANLSSVAGSNRIGSPGLMTVGYGLLAGSHCIDAGLNSVVSTYAPWDYHNWADTSQRRARVYDAQTCQALDILNPGATPGTRVDIGAREYVGACFDPVIGVDGYVGAPTLTVSPNPSNGHITLQVGRTLSGSYHVVDAQGRVILAGVLEETTSMVLDLSGCAAGLYQVTLLHEGRWQARKVLLRR